MPWPVALWIHGDEPLRLGLDCSCSRWSCRVRATDTREAARHWRRSYRPHALPRSGLWRLNAKGFWFLAALGTAPELPLGGDNQVLIERIGMGQDLHPLASSRNHREHRGPSRHHPHIMCSCGMYFVAATSSENATAAWWLENRIAARHPAVQGRRHRFERRMEHPLLTPMITCPVLAYTSAGSGPRSRRQAERSGWPKSSGSASPRFSRHNRTRAA